MVTSFSLSELANKCYFYLRIFPVLTVKGREKISDLESEILVVFRG